jgi:predicted nucleotide-binding protein
MAKSRQVPQAPQLPAVLMLKNDEFKKELENRIEIGNELLNRPSSDSIAFKRVETDYTHWNDYNKEYLKQAFDSSDNEYYRSYGDAGYTFMGLMGEVQNNPAQTLKNLIQYKLTNLQSLANRSGLLKSRSPQPQLTHPEEKLLSKTEVFIVHGHDETAKVKTARFIQQLGLKPIILHEQSSSGRTIIEKIEEYSNVGFGIVLYTPCDVGSKKGDESNLKPRARQNVVFEHGYLIGKIGRKNVCALFRQDVEIPNDISGVVYVKMDDEDAWHLKIAKELRSSGYNIDLNKL